MSSGCMRSFWTPEGAITILPSAALIEMPPPVPLTHPHE